MSSPDNKRRRLKDDASTSGPGGEMAEKSPIQTSGRDRAVCKGKIFDEEAQNFEDIVTLPGFVDRTLFLKEFLRSPRRGNQVMIFAPSKFGKTLNLNMAHLFFDIERDANGEAKRDVTRGPTDDELNSSESMKVFRRHSEDSSNWCKILGKTEFVKEHFGRHPVVHLNFKELEAKNKKEAIVGCAKLVQKAFFKHKYLADKILDTESYLEARWKRECEDWCAYSEEDFVQQLNECGEQTMYAGLEDLIKSLREHWKRDPILLVDEIDCPTVQAIKGKIDGDEIIKIENVISHLVFQNIKTSTPMLAGALITGISYVGFPSFGCSTLDNTTPVYHLNNSRFSKYYGLTEDEVLSLVHCLFDEADRDREYRFIKEHFNGYGDDDGNSRFCLYSVLSYIQWCFKPKLKGVQCDIYWTDDLFQEVANMLRESWFMHDIHTLLSGNNVNVTRPIGKLYAEHLCGIFEDKLPIYKDAILTFFNDRGFLTRDFGNSRVRSSKFGSPEIMLKIPNLEVKSCYHVMLKKYCFSKVPSTARTACARFFRDVSPDVTKHDQGFQTELKSFYANLHVMFESLGCTVEASLSTLVWLVMKDQARYEECLQDLPIKARDEKEEENVVARIDLWMRRGDFAVVWAFKYNKTARDGCTGDKTKSSLAALEDIVPPPEGKPKQNPNTTKDGKYLEAFQRHNIENYLLVGLSLDGDHKLHMRVLANSQNWDDVIVLEP